MPEESCSDKPVINSLTLSMDGTTDIRMPEEYKRGSRSILWLTVREGRTFILKGLPENLRNHPEEVARLRKEYSLGLRINHPGIAGVYGFENHPDFGPVIVMEYIDGVTLHSFLNANKPKPTEVRLSIACQIADALSHIHSLGMSHRDLKPDNILITKRNEAKIIDWGLGDSEDAVTYKQSLGTAEFGAPEQQNPFPGDSRADVYSFGMVLECLLPEKRFQKIRSACQSQEPEQRLTMQEVSERLSDIYQNRGHANAKIYVIIAFVGLFVMASAGYFAMTRLRQSEQAAPQSQSYVKPVQPNGNPINSETLDNEDAVSESIALYPETKKAVSATEKLSVEEQGAIPEQPSLPDEQPNAPAKMSSAQDYDAIYNEYLTKTLKLIEGLGQGINYETGEYNEDVVMARATKLPVLCNELVKALNDAECPYSEVERLSRLFVEETEKAVNRIDGVKP